MVYILHTPAASATADRLRADLQSAGHAIESTQSTTRTQVVIALLGANSESDPSFMQGLLRALDSSQHLLPVLVEDVPLPKVIEHLGALDFTDGYDPKAIQQWLSLVAVTVDAALDRFRPNSTLDATGFPATVQAAPTAARPLLAQTATAQAAELMGTVLPTLTPSPTAP